MAILLEYRLNGSNLKFGSDPTKDSQDYKRFISLPAEALEIIYMFILAIFYLKKCLAKRHSGSTCQ